MVLVPLLVVWFIFGLPVIMNRNNTLAADKNARGIAVQIKTWQSLRKSPPYKSLWAVVIGINSYHRLPPLQHAVNDARSVANHLIKYGFPESNIITLYEQDATRKNILAVVSERLKQLAGHDDGAIIFFAGHGDTLNSKGYIIPIDAVKGDTRSYISMDLLKLIAGRLPAKHLLFIMDSCYSGFALARSGGAQKLDDGFLLKLSHQPVRQVITAGGAREEVFETAGHGIFTEKLLFALEGAGDLNNDGVITGSELGHYLRERVSRASGNTQTPLYGTLSGEGEFLLVRKKFNPMETDELAALRKSVDQYESHYFQALNEIKAEQWDKAKEQLLISLMYKPGDIWAQEKLNYIKERTVYKKVIKDKYNKTMVLVPQGSFIMGAEDGYRDEKPRRQVFTPAFYMDKYEVTNAEYNRFLNYIAQNGVKKFAHPDAPRNLSYLPQSWKDKQDRPNDDKPVSGISWYAAFAYAKWIDKRLPTEAEWEKSLRGVDGRQFPWGEQWHAGSANVKLGLGTTPAIQSIQRNPKDLSPWGISDLLGNVSEWVADHDTEYMYKSIPSDANAVLFKPVRGGSYRTGSLKRLRGSARRFLHPATASEDVGFRLVSDIRE